MGPPERRSVTAAPSLPPPGHRGPVYPPPPARYPGPVTGQWQGALKPPTFVRPSAQRPTYREPFPVRSGPVWAGLGAGALWMLLFALQGVSGTRAYAWFTIVGGVLAWAAAMLLAKLGDRGVAVGVAVAGGIGVAIAGLVVVIEGFTGHWILW
jgi:hypothetical protein